MAATETVALLSGLPLQEIPLGQFSQVDRAIEAGGVAVAAAREGAASRAQRSALAT